VQILALVPEATIAEYFGSVRHDGIWNEPNTSAEHRDRVIEWFDAMISTHVSEELQLINKRAQALKVQDAYRTSKGIAMKQFIDKIQSPHCQIEKEIVEEHFRQTWAPPRDDFIDAQPGHVFFLE
jgi:hypothetical protein